ATQPRSGSSKRRAPAPRAPGTRPGSPPAAAPSRETSRPTFCSSLLTAACLPGGSPLIRSLRTRGGVLLAELKRSSPRPGRPVYGFARPRMRPAERFPPPPGRADAPRSRSRLAQFRDSELRDPILQFLVYLRPRQTQRIGHPVVVLVPGERAELQPG